MLDKENQVGVEFIGDNSKKQEKEIEGKVL